MKYLCLCYYDEKKFAACTPADFEQVGIECQPRDEAFQTVRTPKRANRLARFSSSKR